MLKRLFQAVTGTAPAPAASSAAPATTDFPGLGLDPLICRAVATEGYTHPTPIQLGAIPAILAGRDLLGIAQTGTGKTAAFALPILHQLHAKPVNQRRIRALILTPTRELAIQIAENFKTYGNQLQLRTAVIFGGVGLEPQKQALRRGVDIVIATPGRLLDLTGQGAVDYKGLEILVLDEADRMLDMGFIHDVKKILAHLPKQRQNLLFSATMPQDIAALSSSLLQQPVRVEITPVSSTSEQVTQFLYHVDKGNKRALLLHILSNEPVRRALVFSRTKHNANRVADFLVKAGMSAEAIHGNKSQNARQRALENFRNGTTKVLVASDLAARGLDIEEISHVVNYELPNVPETYVHRIGRTGRAMAIGEAHSFCDHDEREDLRMIERLIGKAIPVRDQHPFHIDPPANLHAGDGRRQGPPQNQRRQGHGGGQRNTPRPAQRGPQQRSQQSGRGPQQRGPRPSSPRS